MDFKNVRMIEIYGGLLLVIIALIIIILFINDFIRKRMIFACRRTLLSKEKITRLSVDEATADYLKRNNDYDLYRVNEFISKKDDIIRYRLCLKKRSFDFYLRKQNLWNYNVVAIQMY